MAPNQVRRALESATQAAQAAGKLMRTNWRRPKKIHAQTQHDIKLELDVRCQKTIERLLRKAFPDIALLGEEGTVGNPQSAHRWVVDPIDGTVNFTYGIPHACVSIALQSKTQTPTAKPQCQSDDYQTVLGVVYDPFCDELWTAVRGQAARLNGAVIHASAKTRLDEAIVAVGFAKEKSTLERMLPSLNQLVHRVRKIRIMGAAALSLTYVATGRMDAYIEYGLRLWDIAAGGLIIECAGGRFGHERVAHGEGGDRYRILASNGRLHQRLMNFA